MAHSKKKGTATSTYHNRSAIYNDDPELIVLVFQKSGSDEMRGATELSVLYMLSVFEKCMSVWDRIFVCFVCRLLG